MVITLLFSAYLARKEVGIQEYENTVRERIAIKKKAIHEKAAKGKIKCFHFQHQIFLFENLTVVFVSSKYLLYLIIAIYIIN